jgi:hypothetical protein
MGEWRIYQNGFVTEAVSCMLYSTNRTNAESVSFPKKKKYDANGH